MTTTKTEPANVIPRPAERPRRRLETGLRAGGLIDDLNSPFRRPFDVPPPGPRPFDVDG
jgi:hypothetical protein